MLSKRSRIGWALVTLTAIGSLGGCQRDASIPLTADEKAAIRAEIDKLRSAYENAVASGNPATLTPLLADGAVMVHPGAPDWSALAEAARGAPFPPGATIAITPLEVVPLSREWAYEFGTSITSYTPEGADTPQQLRDTYLVVFHNTGDAGRRIAKWRVRRRRPLGGPRTERRLHASRQ